MEADLQEGQKLTVLEAKKKVEKWQKIFDGFLDPELEPKTWEDFAAKLFDNWQYKSALTTKIKKSFKDYMRLVDVKGSAYQRLGEDRHSRLWNVGWLALKEMLKKFNKDTQLILDIPESKNHMVIPLTNRAIESLFSKEKFIEKSK